MTAKECREKVEACTDNGTLTQWEYGFLINVTDKLDRGWALTEHEQDRIDEIHTKIYGRS